MSESIVGIVLVDIALTFFFVCFFVDSQKQSKPETRIKNHTCCTWHTLALATRAYARRAVVGINVVKVGASGNARLAVDGRAKCAMFRLAVSRGARVGGIDRRTHLSRDHASMNEAEADTSTTAAAAAAVAATSAVVLPMVSGGKTWTIGTEVWVYWRAYADEPGMDRWVITNTKKKHNIVLFYSNMFFFFFFFLD